MIDFDYGIMLFLLMLATFATRSFFFVLGDSVKIPPWLQHALRYAPATALAAILVPDLLLSGRTFVLPWTNIRLIAAIGATLFFLKTRHLLGTIMVGMVCFTALRLRLN